MHTDKRKALTVPPGVHRVGVRLFRLTGWEATCLGRKKQSGTVAPGYLELCCLVGRTHLGQACLGPPASPAAALQPAPAPGRPGRVELLARAGELRGSQECRVVGPFALAASLPSVLQASWWAPIPLVPLAPTHQRPSALPKLCPFSWYTQGQTQAPHHPSHWRGF